MEKEWSLEELLDLGWQFCRPRIFLSAIELGVFDALLNNRKSARQLAEELNTAPRATGILLDALAATGFLEKSNDLYIIREDLRKYVDPENPESARGMFEHMVHLWEQWSKLTSIARGEEKIESVSVVSQGRKRLESFIKAMDVVARDRADNIVKIVNASIATKLLDVGGASGTYTLAFLKANPKLHATLFDLPEVVEIARNRFKKTNYTNRITFVAGDFYRDPLPSGHDLVFLSAIIHQNSPEENVELFRKANEALVPGGRIVIRDFIMDETRTNPPGGALFAVNMLVNTPGGDTYTFDEVRGGLEEAGFREVRMIQSTNDMDSLVEAKKP